ncbi:hypothetical protein [Streptomyces sp. NPDC056190]|uniref:hypothetical protein n=1 Tax=unclassified Streptomyces TaxID=2593676 RepID=UPI0035E009F8
MTKFVVTVCLPPSSHTDPVTAVTTAMRPFDMNIDPATGEAGYNPHGKWDWWHIGSYDNLVSCPEFDGDPRLIHQPTWPNGEPRPRGRLRCDGGPSGLLDLDGMRALSAKHAAATWAVWARFASEHPPAEPLSAFFARHGVTPGVHSPAFDQAKSEHLAQPLVQALAQYAVNGGDPHYPNHLVLQDPVALFACGEHEYVMRAAAHAVPTYALLTLDGRWADADDPRVLGEPRPDESDDEAYGRLADDHLRRLAEDTVMVQVRCHC